MNRRVHFTGSTQAPPLAPDFVGSRWHSLSVDEVLDAVASDVSNGLTDREAQSRMAAHGPNMLVAEKRWEVARRVASQFSDVLIWVLIAAAGISGLFLESWIDAGAIVGIVLINAVIGFVQETRAATSLKRLEDLGTPETRVVRSGIVRTIDSEELVPGDVVHFETGSLVAADARVVEQSHLVVNEAILTGESMPSAKLIDPVDMDSAIGDRSSMIFAGTTVVSGRGKAVVTTTGRGTEVGRIADLFSSDRPVTPLQVELDQVGRRIALLAALTAGLVFAAGIARSFPAETMLLTAVALAVAAIPEGLPAVVTVSLAGGLQRMAQRAAIVRRLPAVEALGSVDVICTDKTGTLTESILAVGKVILADGTVAERIGSQSEDLRPLVECAGLCNNAYLSDGGFQGDPTEVALIEALNSQGIDTDELASRNPRVDEAGFDGHRKRMSTVNRFAAGHVLFTKGAPEVLLARSSMIVVAGSEIEMTDSEQSRIFADAEELARSGMRALGFAMRRIESIPTDLSEAERDLTFIGLVGFQERIRSEASESIRRAADAGVRTVMVTGDHAETAVAVANSVDLPEGLVMEGYELARMPIETLSASISDYRVFARVDPADKVKIVDAWQSNGSKVAMTGDGVNDAPALHRADVGVAMGSGTDIARESADIVLVDDNYSTIVAAIAEGRRLFNNLRNVVQYLLSSNASEVVYVLVGFLLFGSYGEPILAVQLLWINLMSDAWPAIALGMDKPVRDLMRDLPRRLDDLLSLRRLAILAIQGMILAGAAIGAFLVGLFALDLPLEAVQTMVFTTLVLSQLLHALNIRAGSGRLFKAPGVLMISSLTLSAGLQLLAVYTPAGQRFLKTVPLSGAALGLSLLAAVISMVIIRLLSRSTFGSDSTKRTPL